MKKNYSGNPINKNLDLTFTKFTKVVAFCIIFSIAFSMVSQVLNLKWPSQEAGNRYFYSEPKNSIDVIFFGASSFYKGVSPLVMWNDYKFTSYVRSTSMQSPLGLYNSLLEALDNQTPDLVVLDGIILIDDFDYQKREPGIRKYVDPKPFSLRKVQFIYGLWKYGYFPDVVSMIFPLFRYHDRWSSLEPSDYSPLQLSTIIDSKGQSITYEASPQTYPSDYMQVIDTKPKSSKDARKFFDQVIKVCKEKSIKVIFITLPRLNWSYKKHISVNKYAVENDIPYIDLSFPEEISKINLNLETDFYDEGHLNIFGSQKTAIYLGNILSEKYQLSSHRDNNLFDYWNVQYSLYKENYLDHQIENKSDDSFILE